MAIAELITELKATGIELWTESGQLRFRAPKGLLTEEIRVQLRAKKAEIIAFLEAEEPTAMTADPNGRHQEFPLTDIQEAYLLGRHGSFGYGGVACHGYLEMHYPKLDHGALERAWNRLVRRHEMLRCIVEAEGYQRILAEVVDYEIEARDMGDADPSEIDELLGSIRGEMSHRMHPTGAWPMFELRRTRTPSGDIVHFSMDSLVADWASAGILFRELEAILADPEVEFTPIEISFRDYVLKLKQLRESPQFQRDRAYWLSRVDDLPAAPELPTLPERSADGPVRFCRHGFKLEADRWTRFQQAAATRGLTDTVAVLTAFASVIDRWSARADFSLSLTLLNRPPLHPQIADMIGDFTSVSLLEVHRGEAQSFTKAAATLGQQLFADLDHRSFSAVELLREMARRRGSAAALMPVVFTGAIGLESESEASALKGKPGYSLTQTPQVVLDCQVRDSSEGLELNWDIRGGVFPEGLIEDMFAALTGLLTDLADNEATWDASDPVVVPSWQRQVRERVNATEGPLPKVTLDHRIRECASKTPTAIAVVDAQGQWTYAHLVERAASLASSLRAAGVGTGDRVGVQVVRGIHQIVAVVATVWAGACYVPVDPAQPELRRDKILLDAGVRVVLVNAVDESSFASSADLKLVVVDGPREQAAESWATNHGPDELAYVLYTSGSTGAPKGVMITHRSALNTIEDMDRRFGVTASDTALGLAQLGFDLSVYDIFGTLGRGGTLVIPDPSRGADPSHWAELIAEYKVAVWNSVPAQLQMLVTYLESESSNLAALRLALLSGDWIPVTLPASIRRFLPEIELIGLGGATEASIWSNFHRIEEVDPAWVSIPYGVPLTNQGFRVLDGALRDAPIWSRGELYITGVGLAQGYLGDSARSEASFFKHPVDGQRLYRTGDWGRYLPSGEIEFLGREDGQVKIRGHRIELGEIESALLSHPGVDTAVVLAHGPVRERSLLAFVKPGRIVTEDVEPPSRLSDAALRFAEKQLGEASAEVLSAFFAGLERASLTSMLEVMRGVGLFEDGGAGHSSEEICAALQADPRHHWLVRRWLSLLAEAGLLTAQKSGDLYCSLKSVASAGAEQAWQAFAKLAVENDLCGEAFVAYHRAHVERLPALLKDECNPFDLLFPKGELAVAHAIYRDHALARYLNHAVAAIVRRIASPYAEAQDPLRIAELGGGSAATTGAVVAVLDGCEVDYLFTDIMAFFLPEAKRAFSPYPWFRTACFDLNAELRDQGLTPNSFDIIICAGMLTSTGDVADALGRAVEMLAPGGWLVWTEPTQDCAHVMLTQGFMMDPAGDDRSHGSSKFLSSDAWRELVEARGGQLVVELPARDSRLVAAGMAVFAARFKVGRAALRPESLTRYLGERLPAHMLPSQTQIVDELPLTANGKVDRNELDRWHVASTLEASLDTDQDQLDDLEQAIATIWTDTLGIESIGRRENFYDRGADSLILARVAGRLRDELPEAGDWSYDLLLRQMLNEPTLGALAVALRGTEGTSSSSSEGASAEASTQDSADSIAPRREGSNSLIVKFDEQPLTSQGEPLARVMFHAALGTMDYFQSLGRALAAQKLGPVLGVAVSDVEQYLTIEPTKLIEQLADDYAQRLVDEGFTRFQLVGYCLGGLLATEVARRLLERGVAVEDLTLVDAAPMFLKTDEELAFEAIFVPNLDLDPLKTVLGDGLTPQDLRRAIEHVLARHDGKLVSGGLASVSGDPGLEAVAAAVRRCQEVPQEQRLEAYTRVAQAQSELPVDPKYIPSLFRVCRHSMQGAQVTLEPYVGDMNYLRCTEAPPAGLIGEESQMAVPFWQDLCLGAFELHDVSGDHFSVMEAPHVHRVAEFLGEVARRTSGTLAGRP